VILDLWDRLGFLHARCPFCDPTNSVSNSDNINISRQAWLTRQLTSVKVSVQKLISLNILGQCSEMMYKIRKFFLFLLKCVSVVVGADVDGCTVPCSGAQQY